MRGIKSGNEGSRDEDEADVRETCTGDLGYWRGCVGIVTKLGTNPVQQRSGA